MQANQQVTLSPDETRKIRKHSSGFWFVDLANGHSYWARTMVEAVEVYRNHCRVQRALALRKLRV